MQENKEKDIEEIFSDVKEYVETRLEYTRLKVVEKSSKIFADIVTNATVIICFILAFLFGSFTLALFLSDIMGSYTMGFGCVALLYLALAILVFLTKDRYIEKGIVNFTIKNYFNKYADKDEGEEL